MNVKHFVEAMRFASMAFLIMVYALGRILSGVSGAALGVVNLMGDSKVDQRVQGAARQLMCGMVDCVRGSDSIQQTLLRGSEFAHTNLVELLQ